MEITKTLLAPLCWILRPFKMMSSRSSSTSYVGDPNGARKAEAEAALNYDADHGEEVASLTANRDAALDDVASYGKKIAKLEAQRNAVTHTIRESGDPSIPPKNFSDVLKLLFLLGGLLALLAFGIHALATQFIDTYKSGIPPINWTRIDQFQMG